MKKLQSGFTLIELVVVIVLLGILGVTALGKFQDLSADASSAAVSGVASEISAAAAINFSSGVVGTPDVTIDSTAGAAITADGTANACDDTDAAAGRLFQSNTFPAGYAMVSNTAANCGAAGAGAGSSFNCTVFSDDNNNGTLDAGEASAIATLICTGA